jgi:quercetin 2,3-dioxygenase
MNRTLLSIFANYRRHRSDGNIETSNRGFDQQERVVKKVLGIYSNQHRHWVGDGFPVRSLFSYDTLGQQMSPFLLLDYAGPSSFEPTTHLRGVGSHPHRGIETVTIIYDGEVAHRDSTGQGGVIGAGDVQWMTSGSGILHEEFHSAAFAARGGTLEMIQLWVNLPATAKMTTPGYQGILSAAIPTVSLGDGGGNLRVIAGEFEGHRGPAHTHSEMQVWDVKLSAGQSIELPAQAGWNTALVVRHGSALINASTQASDAEMVLFDPEGSRVSVLAQTDVTLLWLSGEPLNEPIVGQGPFVMNTQEEIHQAMADFRSGKFGKIA